MNPSTTLTSITALPRMATASTAAALLLLLAPAASPAPASSSPPLGGDTSPSYGGGGGKSSHAPKLRLALVGSTKRSVILGRGQLRIRLTTNQAGTARVTASLRPSGARTSVSQPQVQILFLTHAGSRVVVFKLSSQLGRALAQRRVAALTVRAVEENGASRLGRATLYRRLTG
ncbi:MAG: hypothetical protein ACR2HD_05635 [Solirubrobacteraceae bacterium]|nr:MAG: hypothetical protein DLM63_03265 [Solirubrobacterales bacterium]